MKRYLVIGNPIEHSLSPKLHNFWMKKHNINAFYEKEKILDSDLKDLIKKIQSGDISGINVTVPFKKKIINYLDKLSPGSEITQSVNTVCLNGKKLIGYNTDIDGFELAIKDINFDFSNKKILILGAGGVVPSIIFALKKLKSQHIIVSNRTKEKAEDLKNLFKDIEITNWGDVPDFDLIINATSIGLKYNEKINLDLSKISKGKFFYDVIYNPKETNFLKEAKKLGNKTENGRKMFIYQAAAAFELWHKIRPEIDENVNVLLND
jgi:shikimate dehydrogenase